MPNNAKAYIIGNLVRDPEMKTVGQSTVCSFTVAVNTTQKKADGTFDSNFYDCSYWGKPGEFLFERAQKGTQVVASGDLVQSEYTAQDGTVKHRLRLNCNDVRAVARLKERGAAPAAKPAAPTASMDPVNDEVPF